MSSNSANFGLNNIVTSGSLGVNTYLPSYQLDVAGTGNINLLKINDQYAFPTGVGSVGDSLVYAGSNQVAWSGVSGGGGLTCVSGNLCGNLNLNSYDILGTGDIAISGNVIANSGTLDVLSFNVNNESILTKGQISWDDTEGTMDIGLTDNTTIHVGEHRYFRIRNQTGGILYKGQVVYATGVHSNGLITPAKYVADGTVREVRFMGVVLEDVNDQNNGYVADFGHLENMDLDGSATNYAVGDETWSAGDILYIHPTVAGKLTKNEPKHSIAVAIILDVGNGNGNGRMFVRPTSYGHLDDNHDVAVSGATNGQFLQYNSVTDYWVPSSSGNFTTLQVNGTLVPTGVGTSNYVTKWTGTNGIGNSVVYDNGTNVGIGTATPAYKLDVNGTINSAKLEITNTSTDDSLLITTTEDSSTAAPVLTFKRNSSSPADGDYLGQLKFKGENDADQEVVYAKVTAKISDATDTTEDGLFEFALRKAGSNNIGMRLTSTGLNLLNGTEMDMGSQQIHSVLDPTSAQDAATKNYVDSNHITISAASSVDNSNGSVIQDITLDTNGHVTALGSIDLDSRYYTESEIDAFNYVDGNGTASYLPKWSDTDTLTDSVIYDAGTNIGIGTTSPSAKLHIQKDVIYPGAGTAYGQYTDVNSEITSNGTNYILGLSIDARKDVNTGVTDTGYIMGADIVGVTEGGGDITASYGIRTYAGMHTASSGTITNAFGVRSRVLNLGTGAITNGYGLYIDDVAATSGYGVYQIGSDDKNYFNGSVGIGTDNPASKLTVASTNEEGIRIHTVSSPSQNFIIGRNTSNGTLVFKGSQSDFSGYEFRSTIGGSSQTVLQTDRLTGALTLNNAFTFPTGDGTNSQVLATDGNGNVSWSGISDILSGFSDYEVLTTSKSTFTVNGGYTVGSLDVYYNGLKLIDGDDYTATNGTTFTLASAAGSADVIEWEGHRTAPEYATIGNPGNYRLAISDGSSTSLNAQSDLVYDTTGLGVGTSSPSYKLDVNGTFSANSINVNDVFTLPTTDGSNGQSLSTDGAGNVTWEHPKSSYIMSVMFG